MVTKSGHLFRILLNKQPTQTNVNSLLPLTLPFFFSKDIDFGHFLGNIKKWAGISRERAPFIFTPEFAYGKVAILLCFE
jgi:hypothetical protein